MKLALATLALAAVVHGTGYLEPEAPSPTPPAATATSYALAVYAHRGGDAGGPDSSMVAFNWAIAHGYHIETDARLAKDGTVWLSHDDYLLSPRCNRNIRISAATARDLRLVYCEGQPLVSLAQLVSRLGQPDAAGTRALVEGKAGTKAEADVILSLTLSLGDRFTFQTFVADQWRYVEELSPKTVTCALWTYGTPAPLGEPVDMLCPWSGVVTDEVIADGRPVIAWVVNDAATAAQLAERGAAGVISDKPEVIRP
jgi:hypothetical protein